MRQKMVSLLVVTALVLSLGSASAYAETAYFANEDYVEQIQQESTEYRAEEIADIVEECTGTADVMSDINGDSGEYTIVGEESEISISSEDGVEVSVETEEGDAITMDLPAQFSSRDGSLAGEGTVVFDEEASNISVAIQGVQERQGDVYTEGFRSLVAIENARAPQEYDFTFHLPDGCRMMTSEEYHGDNSVQGCIYIVNVQNRIKDENSGEEALEVIGMIDAAWAMDANGNNVDTYYCLHGNTLTQKIEFDERSVFPIVMDPKTTTKPKGEKVGGPYHSSFTLNHYVVGSVSYGYTSKNFVLKKKVREGIEAAVAKKLGSKFIPVLNWVSFIVDGYTLIQGARGYKKTLIDVTYEKWTCYKHQGAGWVKGYQVKIKRIKITFKK